MHLGALKAKMCPWKCPGLPSVGLIKDLLTKGEPKHWISVCKLYRTAFLIQYRAETMWVHYKMDLHEALGSERIFLSPREASYSLSMYDKSWVIRFTYDLWQCSYYNIYGGSTRKCFGFLSKSKNGFCYW